MPHRSAASAAGVLSFNPLRDSTIFAWWDRDSVATGLVSSWIDKVSGAAWEASGSERPTKSLTDLGGYPGISGDGVANIMTCDDLGTRMNSLSEFTSIFSGINRNVAGAQAIFNHTVNDAVGDGTAGILLSSDTLRINGDVRSVALVASRGLRFCTRTMVGTPIVVSIGHTFNRPDGIAFIRVNGVAQALTTLLSAATPTNFANASMFLFARSGLTGPWNGTLGDFALRSGVAEDATLAKTERYFGLKAGITW